MLHLIDLRFIYSIKKEMLTWVTACHHWSGYSSNCYVFA